MQGILDRLMLAAACGENQLRRKVGGALCALRRSGGSETCYQLPSIMDCVEMAMVTSDSWGLAHGADPGEVLQNQERLDVAAKLDRNMAWLIKGLAETKVSIPEGTHHTGTSFIR